jgi:pimeloyl-ACP methyl ester carboxylesterase
LDVATFHASRRFAEVESGRIAYVEQGEGPAALFIHGVPLNGYHWRHVIDRLKHKRRCIAIDLMGLGYSEIAPGQDVSFTAQAQMITEVIDALDLGRVDLVANDSGGAIAQIFAAHHPERLASLTLTNCDVHDGWPPPQVLPVIERARNNTLAQVFQPLHDHPQAAHERYARGESVPLFRAYADPSVLTPDVIRLYLAPLLSSPQRIAAFQRYWLAFDNRQTTAIHSQLKELQVPTLIVWALDDFFFDVKWAYWLKDTIPGARRVVTVKDARLFFAEDRPDALVEPLRDFLGELNG